MHSILKAGVNISKRIAVAMALLSLLTLNVFTLVDDDVHAKAYGVLEDVVGMAGAGSLLKNSPTEVRRRDVAIATQTLRSKMTNLTHHTLELVAATRRLIVTTDAVKAEKDSIAALARTLEMRNARARAAAQTMSRGIAQRLAKGASRSVSLLAGKAVPYFGIAVTVAVTGLDLLDACETVKEINQFAVSLELPAADHTAVCGVRVPTRESVVESVSANFRQSYMAAEAMLNQAGESIPPLPSSFEASKMVKAFLFGPLSLW